MSRCLETIYTGPPLVLKVCVGRCGYLAEFGVAELITPASAPGKRGMNESRTGTRKAVITGIAGF